MSPHLMTGSLGFRASRRCHPSMSRSWRFSVAAWCESTRFLSASARATSHAASSSSSCFLACLVGTQWVNMEFEKGLLRFMMLSIVASWRKALKRRACES